MRGKKSIYILFGLALLPAAAALVPPAVTRLDNSKMQSWRIYDDRGRLLREVLSEENGRGAWVPLREMGVEVARAIVAVEDKRFYRHPGVDPLAIMRAAWLNLRQRQVLSGGSTLTQQLARMMYGLPRTWYAKPAEALLALRLELWLDKREILEQYLNRAPFGNQLFGVEAASRAYFGQPARQLSLAEAAFLAGLPQSPTRYNPYGFFARASQRQRQVLDAMRREGMIDGESFTAALEQPIALAPRQSAFAAPHFCQMVLAQLHSMPGVGHEIHTTLSGGLQARVESLADGHLEQLAKNHVTNAAVLVLDNASGAVKAWVGSRNFFDALHQGQVDGVRALRQPGSAVKPFTYALALENGFTASSILADIETHAPTESGDLAVHNYDEKYHGPVRLRTALACSYNVATVRLLETLGADLLLERLQLGGLSSLKKPAAFYGLGLTLGNGEVALRDMTNAFRALANGGVLRPLTFLAGDNIALGQAAGETGAASEWQGERIFDKRAAFIISDILSDHRARAPAFGLGGPLHLPFACAAKTGTTKDFRDNWTIGYTTEYTVGVWVGNFDGEPMEKISGITGAAPLFRDIMLELHANQEPAPFPVPSGVTQAPICPVSGQQPAAACPGALDEWFISGTEPHSECAVHRRVAIDRRNGLLASAATPASAIEEEVYEVWPPEYRGWMAANRLPVPPEEYYHAGSPAPARLAIAFPDEGAILKIDPVLRREYQTIMLEAVVPDGMPEIEWMVNDTTLARVRAPFLVRWQLRAGAHRFMIRGRRHGEFVSSAPVTIQVF